MLRYLLSSLLPLTATCFSPMRAHESPNLPVLSQEAVAPVAAGALERVAVIGASASAGFLLPTDLGETLDWLLDCEHEPVLAVASSRFFLDPYGNARRQVAAAEAAEASAVVALDFLFWFSYGLVANESDRLRLLESGLEFLESFDCPLLTSTVPDMRASTGKMLMAAQVPSVETLQKLNQRIEEWAAGRPNVVLVHLPRWHTRFLAGERFDVDGIQWPPRPTDSLLLWDQLHPTIEGLSLLSCKILEHLAEASPEIDRRAIRLDPRRVAGPLHARMKSIMGRR